MVMVKEEGTIYPRMILEEAGTFILETDDDEYGEEIQGTMFGNRAKMIHIVVNPNRRNEGRGKALLQDMERELQKRGIKNAYALFMKPDTIEFFLHMGYTIVDVTKIKKGLLKKIEAYPDQLTRDVKNKDDFERGKKDQTWGHKKILVHKKLTPKGKSVQSDKSDRPTTKLLNRARMSLRRLFS